MYLAGFSINVLSMLAIVLAVGLVVDDAIVMTENIYIRIEKGMSPKEAGIEGAKEIFFAVISTTITLVAVFFPIVFMHTYDGKYQEQIDAKSSVTASLTIQSISPLFLYLNKSDIRQIAVLLVIVETVSYHKFIRNDKSHIIHIDIHHSPVRLIQKRTQSECLRISCLQILQQIA